MKTKILKTPIDKEQISNLRIGDIVYISGMLYTARDMAHLKIKDLFSNNEKLPEDFFGSVIFHAGPIVKNVDGELKLLAIGPTTSTRMEPYADMVGQLGVRVIIGKGGMGEDTIGILEKYGYVYLLAAPGCGAFYLNSFKKILRVHWLEELAGLEAMWVITVERFGPLFVAMDSKGNSVFKNITDKAKNKRDQWFG